MSRYTTNEAHKDVKTSDRNSSQSKMHLLGLIDEQRRRQRAKQIVQQSLASVNNSAVSSAQIFGVSEGAEEHLNAKENLKLPQNSALQYID